MSKSVNHHLVKWAIRVFLAAIFILIVCLFLSSCNVEKRAIRKQDKAYGITVSTPRTFSQAGALWLNIHPCLVTVIKDSIVTKHDTLITEKKLFIPFKVTEYKTKQLDTIIDNVSIYIDSNGITVKNLNEVQVKTEVHYQTKVDETKVKLLTDTLNFRTNQLSFKQGQLDSTTEASKAKDKKIDKLWFWLILLSVASVLSHVARSYIPKIPSLLSNK